MRKYFPHFPTRNVLLRALVTLALMASVLPVVNAAPGVPNLLHYQGRLLDDTGNLLGGSGTDYCFRFAFYDDATVGAPDNQLWPASTPGDMTVSVVNGVFAVGIGDTGAGGDTLDYTFTDDTTYLNIEVATQVGGSCGGGDETYETLNPRQQILSSGYAINSGSVFGTNQSAIGTTSAQDNTVLTLEATSTSAVPLVIRRIASQVSDLFSVISETAQSLFTINENGNVGIGTSTPYAKLSVVGDVVAASFAATTTATSTFAGGIETNLLNITATNASSTFANGIDITNGCFSINGSCIDANAASSYVDLADTPGSITANAIQFGNSGGTALTQSSTFVFDGTNLGVGTATPVAQIATAGLLYVGGTGTSTFQDNLHVLDTLQVGSGSLFLTNDTITGSGAININAALNSDVTIDTSGTGDINIGNGSFVVDGATGNIGIGTSSPYEALSIVGNIVASSFVATTTTVSQFTGAIETDLITVSSTTATSTFANGISLSGGCVLVNGSCLASTNDFNTFAELDTIVSDKLLVNLDDAQTFQSLITFTEGFTGNASSTLNNSTGGGDTTGVALNFEKSRGGGGVASGDSLGFLNFSGFDGLSYNQGAVFEAVTEGSIAVGRTPTSFRFSTENLAGDFGERFRITANGDVGVATTSPAARFTVEGDTFLSGDVTATGTVFANTLNVTNLGTFESGFISEASTTILGDFTIDGDGNFDFITVGTTTATSSFANGVRLTGGCFELPDGNCLETATATQHISLTVDVNSNATAGNLNLFDEDNYTSYATTSNGVSGISIDDTNGRFTINESGIYHITLNAVLENSVSGDVDIEVHVNGSPVYNNGHFVDNTIDGTERTVTLLQNLVDTDFVEFYAESVGGNVTAHEGTSATIFKLGPIDGAGGGGGGSLAIEEEEASVQTSATTLDFGGNDFIATNSGGGEVDIDIDYANSGITRNNQNETITGLWEFDQASSTRFSIIDTLYIGGTATTTIVGNNSTSTFAGGIESDALNITSTSASSTFANGITLTGGCVQVNGSCIESVGSSGIGDLSDVDTAGVQFGNVLTYDGANWVDTATSSLAIALSDTTGTLAATRGGTGLSTVTNNQLLVGGVGNTWTQIATSSLGLLTTDIAEGTNEYWTNARFDTRLIASTTVVNLDCSSGEVAKADGLGGWSCAIDVSGGGGGGGGFWATSTDDLTQFPTLASRVVVVGGTATTTTGNIFEVIGASQLGSLTVSGQSTFEDGFTAEASSTLSSNFVDADSSYLTFEKSRGGAIISSGDSLGSIQFTGDDGPSFNLGAEIEAVTEGSIGFGQTPTGIRFSTENLSGTFAERVRITPAGNLGIGTTSPIAALGIQGNGLISGSVTVDGTINVRSTGASSTFANGIDLSDGCFAVDGTCIGTVVEASDLSDVDTTGAAFGNVLTYDGANWVDTATSSLAIAISDTVGTLAATRGGTGLSTITNNQLLVGGPGDTVTQIATSSLGLLTTDVAEGTNEYWTNARFDTRLIASTTVVNLDCSNGQVAKADGLGGWNCGADVAGGGGGSGLWATSTDDLAQFPTVSSRVIVVGGSATTTTGNIFEVIGASQFDNITADGTLSVSGLTTLGQASSTRQSIVDRLYVGGSATTTIRGDSSTSTFSHGVDIAAGCFAIGGTCLDLSGDVAALSDLSDADSTGAVFGNVLTYDGANWVDTATSALAISTTDLVEGSNLFYTQDRVAGVIAGTTTDALSEGSTNRYYATSLFATDLAGTTTTALAEGTNLYYTQDRVAGVIAGTTTDALSEGSTNRYYATSLFATDLAGTTTTAISEGTNLYWTDTRFDNRLSATSSLPDLNELSGLGTVGSSSATTTFLGGISGVGLDITGSATSTFANGITLSGGCVLVNGSCLGSTDDFDTFAELDALVSDKLLVNLDDAQSFQSLITFNAGIDVQASSTLSADSTDAGASYLNFEKSSGGGGIGSGDELGALRFSGFDGSSFNLGANIEAVTEGTIVVGQTPTSLRFGTENLGGTFGERMRITPDGNVGIGTTSPYEELSVGGDIVANTFFADDSAATSTFAGLSANLLSVTATNASSTFANGINITGGCFSINGVCTSSAIEYTSLTDTPSSLTANALQFANPGATAVTQSASLTFDGTTFVAPTTTLTGLLTPQQGFISTASSTVDGDFTVTGALGLASVDTSSTTATSTFAYGVRISGGCFEDASGTCLQISNPVVAQYYNGSGGGNIHSSTATSVPFEITVREDTGITASTTEPSAIHLDEAGWYRVSYQVVGEGNGTNDRTNVQCGIQMNSGGSYLNGSYSYSYTRYSTDTLEDESSNSGNVILETTSADEWFEVYCEAAGTRTTTMQLQGNQSSLNIEKIGGTIGGGGGGGGGGSTIIVEENDATVLSSASTLDFEGDDFIAVNAGGGEVNIDIDYANSGITRGDQNESITGDWIFTNGASSTEFTAFDNVFVGGTATTTISGNNSTSTFAGGIETDLLNITGSATSTFANGLILNTGCIIVNGICLGSDTSYLSLADTPSSFTANAIQFSNSGATALSQDANFVFDAANDRLGIGVSSPQGVIDIYSETDTDFIFESGINTSAGPDLIFRKSQEGGGAISGDEVGILKFQAFDGLSYNDAANIDIVTEGTILVGQTPASIRLSTEDTSGNFGERVRITPGGFLGVATTSPTSRFSVAGDGYISGDIVVISTSTSGVLEVTSTTASSTFANGLNLTEGCFAVNGTCLGSSAVEQMDDLSDVDTAGVQFGNVLTYDGANWVDTSTSSLQIAIADTVGTLSTTRGGTGLTSITNNQVLVGGPGNTVVQLATSSLGLLTTDVAEGTNQYWTNDRFDTRLIASTTVVNLDCGSGQVAKADGIGGWNCGADISGSGGGSGLWATSSDALSQFPTESGRVVIIGGSATTSNGNIFEVIGASQFDNIDADGTLSVTGLTTLGQASSTRQSIVDRLYIGGSATTTIRGDSSTSTFAHGIDVADGCVSVGGTCIVSATSVNLNDIQDVSLSSPSFGDQLQYNGTNWVNIATSTLMVALSDTTGTLPVDRGGTGATTFSSGGFLFGNGTGAVGASSSPTVGWVVATSTTATSTFANGISITGGCAEVGGECLTVVNEYTDLSDTPSVLIANALQYVNAAGTALEQVATFVYDAAGGRLGIGEANPEYILHTSSTTDGSVLFEDTSSDTEAADIFFRKSRGASGIQSGDELGSLQFTGFDLGSNNVGASIDVVTEGSIAVGQTPSSIRFSTDSLDGTFGERVRITPDGNLGIGTTSPYERLSVAGGIVADYITATTTATSTFAGGIETNLLNITSSTASSTFANGIVVESGCVSVNGLCLAGEYTALADTPTTLTANAVQFANSGGTALDQAANFTFNGTVLSAPAMTITGSSALTVSSAGATSTFAGFIEVDGVNSTSTFAGNVLISGNASTTNLVASNSFRGAGLTDCNATSSKLTWDAATGQFSCADDQGAEQFFNAFDDTGGVRAPTSPETLNMSSTTYTGDAFTLETDDEITIHATGTYFVSASLTTESADQTGAQRTYVTLQGQDTRTGSFSDITGASCSGYTREQNAGIHRTGCSLTWIADYEEGDQVRLQWFQGLNTNYETVADFSHITITQLSDAGADYAEVYYSEDESLSNGDIVVSDPSSPSGVRKSTEAYQGDMIGIVSTEPGQVIGVDTSIKDRKGLAIGLTGRVPLKVNFDNGVIEAGDPVTASDVPGVGMKAVKPGQVIGIALEGYTEEDAAFDREVGLNKQIMVFVNPHWYGGDPERFANWFDFENLVAGEGEEEEEITGMRRVVYEVLQSFGLVLERGMATVSSLFADEIVVKNAEIREAVLGKARVGDLSVENSLQMTDQRTGKTYCMVLVDGALEPQEGTCESLHLTEGSDAPVITINGNNPAQLDIGSDYADLGALVTDDRDNNLGIETLLDGSPVSSIALDTSEAREYVITYRATDNDGNTTEVDRIVRIGEVEEVLPEEPVEIAEEEDEETEEEEEVVVEEDTETTEEVVIEDTTEDTEEVATEEQESTEEVVVDSETTDVVSEDIETQEEVATEEVEEVVVEEAPEDVVLDEGEPLTLEEDTTDA